MPVLADSIPAALRFQAKERPDARAITFVDYDDDPEGLAETVTWAELYHRVRVVALEIGAIGKPGDRVAIVAPQGLEYIVGFLAALEAGRCAVPLSVPQFGQHDERVSAVLLDCAPVAVLTTSAVVDTVVGYTRTGRDTPAVIEIDVLDLDGPLPPARPGQPDVRYPVSGDDLALLQYTSGSTRTPAGVMVTHRNIVENLKQVYSDYFAAFDNITPPDMTPVSWLPLYHDMGLLLGVFAPVLGGLHAVVMSPMSFLVKPARWMQQLAGYTKTFTAAPNFAFELAARRTTDADLAGLDHERVLGLISGSERIHAATIRRFTERFARSGMSPTALLPSYGLAEATLYVASLPPEMLPETAWFDYEKLTAGHAERCAEGVGLELVSYGPPRASTIAIVDPETCVEKSSGGVGEIWLHGPNVAAGYWRNPEGTAKTFDGRLVDPAPGRPEGPWLRTGDLAAISEGDMFIVGRIKDLLIIDGRNHYPDDIESTVQERTGGRAVAVAVPDDTSEQLVVVAEIRQRTPGEAEVERLRTLVREVTASVSRIHGVRVADLMLVAPGSIPVTTSGKIRRSACGDRYRDGALTRLDGTA